MAAPNLSSSFSGEFLEDEIGDSNGYDRTLTYTLDPLPDASVFLVDLTRHLATVALALWPTWYGQSDLFQDSNHTTDGLLNRFACLDLRASGGGINLPWLKAAVRTCIVRCPPVMGESFPTGLQLHQLKLAIEPGRLRLAIALTDPAPLDHRLFALAKTLPWLAEQTKADVALLIPQRLADAPALAPVMYNAVMLAPPAPTSPAADTETKHTVYPIHGRPHPFSPGEQKLAQQLMQDPELSPLFRFNQSVITVKQSRYLVDLLWAAGRVVVEVDGYQYHSNRDSFSRDRRRDYELLVSGYIVLRLPHDEVIDDVAMAVEKIRDVVRFRRLDGTR